MKAIVTVLAAVAGGIAGFIAGLYLAFSTGLHEQAHVFGVALTAAAAFSLAAVALVTRELPTTRAGKSALNLVLLALSTFFFIWLLDIINII